MSRFPELMAAALVVVPAAAMADGFDLGREATPEEVAAWDIDVRPDGKGLPEGGMSAFDGEDVYVQKCASCHGDFAEGVDRWPALAGGWETLTSERPVKTVGSYWPFASTLWDYVHRAMPFGAAQTLTDDEVYGVSAYVLYMNDIIEDDEFVLSDETLPEIEMPNADGFFMDPRPDTPVYEAAERCMEDCKDEVKITMSATVLDVTPDDEVNPPSSIVEEPEDGAAAKGGTTVAAAGPDPNLVETGEKVFRQCVACHQVGEGAESRIGPALNGIVGAPAGAVEGFRYSDALESAADEGMVWTEENLHDFLEDPHDFLPGTIMGFPGLDDAADREAVIAFLKSHGG